MAAFVTGGRPRAGLRACALLAAILAAAPRADAAEAVVTVQLDNRVEIVDLDAGKVVATIPVPGSPAGIALSPDRRTAYVTRPDAPGLGIVDLAARTLTASLPLPGGPLGIACNPRSGAVYVADWYARRVLVLVPGEGGLRLDNAAVSDPKKLATPERRPWSSSSSSRPCSTRLSTTTSLPTPTERAR